MRHDGAVTASDGPTFERYPSRTADVGGMPVRRALPRRQHRTVGAWCFVDHFGPATSPPDAPMEIGPHPHIGLQTVTWLLDGEVLHRDSLGSEQLIQPGELNLMTSGRGIAHSEETQPGAPARQHGAQLWVALPEATRHGAPAFEHHADLPVLELGAMTATVLVGALDGTRSTARTDTPLVGVALGATAAATATMPVDPGFEHGLVVLDGALTIDGERVTPGELAYLGIGRDEVVVAAEGPTHALLLGGEPFESEIFMWWNFVARTRAEIDEARADWGTGSDRFGPVDSALARIPAPEG